MYYATAGQQATQPTNQSQATRGMSIGPAGFPPISGSTTGGGGVTRGGGPPGFASRGADPNDFPALGTSLHPSSSYASQAQQQQSQQQQQQPSPISQPGQHQPQQSGQSSQQQMYIQQGLVPPPPPGIAGPASQSGGSGTGTNGMLEQLRGEEFPALGSEKDRMSNYLRTAPSHHSPPSQSTLPNGSSSANTNGAATSPSAQHPDSWASAQRPSPSQQLQPQQQQQEPVVRPIQQILSSPVDKWGLAALLFEIKTQMGQTDRGMLMFGEELSELGVDVTSDQQLYRTFTTPWLDSHQIHSARIQDLSAIPPHYQFPPPNMAPKMVNLSEDTLLIAFYSSPQDSVQLDAAIELYNRGWRYHIETQLWLFATSLAAMDGSDPSLIDTPPRWLKGPFVYFDPRTLTRDRMPDDYMINHNLIELTRPAGERQRTRGLEVHVDSSESSGSTRVGR